MKYRKLPNTFQATGLTSYVQKWQSYGYFD